MRPIDSAFLAACERAKETARVRRPRFTASILGSLAVVVVLLVSGGWAVLDLFRAMLDDMSGAASPHRASRWSHVWVQLFQLGVLVGAARRSWARARTSSHPRRFRALAVFAALFAGVSLLFLVTLLLE